jgi:hypothetical protein
MINATSTAQSSPGLIDRLRWSLPILLAVVATMVLGFFVILRPHSGTTVNDANQADRARMAECWTNSLATLKPEKTDLILLRQVSDLCYDKIRQEYMLGDFTIRRTTFLEQQVEGRVLLWMVVAITVSGVFLAGLQLYGAYKLASAGRGTFAEDSNLTLEQNKVSLKSSVTGLLILAVSFAFFTAYVKYVYPVTMIGDVNTAPSKAADTVQDGTPFLPNGGGLGKAPMGTKAQ